MKFSVKLVAYFLIVGILSITTLGLIAYYTSKEALVTRTYEQLNSIKTIKKNQIEGWFAERFGDIKVYANNSAIQMASKRFIDAFDAGGLSSRTYMRWDEAHGAKLQQYVNEYGYYDLFFISPSGDVVYTVAKEGDLGENVINGKLAGSGLSQAFKSGLKGFELTDFEWYDVSNEPASFISGPVLSDTGELIGVIVYQLSLEAINKIMQEKTGLGESGESYLVGNDFYLRSDSRFSSESTVLKQKVETKGVKLALSGNDDTQIIDDYRGIPVLSSFSSLDINGLEWAILAEIDETEVMNPVNAMRNTIAIVALVILSIIVFISLLIRREIKAQLGEEPDEIARIAESIANGDLTITFNNTGNKVGVYKSMHDMSQKLIEIVSSVKSGATNVSMASQQLSSSSQQISSGASEQAAGAEEVSSSMEEMAANIEQNTESAIKTRDISNKSSLAIEQVSVASEESMNAVKDIYSRIDEVVKIAEKTDLLAINAAVEAARAGDQGRGFAVVAAEVRKLAERSQSAANDIVSLAERGMNKTEESTRELKLIVPDIQETSVLVDGIAAASLEQKQGADQVNSAIQQLSNVTQQNASSAEEMASGSEELSSQAQELEAVISFFTTNDDKTTTSYKNITTQLNESAQQNGNSALPFIDLEKDDSVLKYEKM